MEKKNLWIRKLQTKPCRLFLQFFFTKFGFSLGKINFYQENLIFDDEKLQNITGSLYSERFSFFVNFSIFFFFFGFSSSWGYILGIVMDIFFVGGGSFIHTYGDQLQLCPPNIYEDKLRQSWVVMEVQMGAQLFISEVDL